MRKPVIAALTLLAMGGISGCGISTRGAEDAVPAAQVHLAKRATSAAVVLLSHRPAGTLVADGATPGLTEAAVDAYRAADGTDTVTFKNAGTATAFAALCGGQVDLVDSSEPMTSAEAAVCERAGLRPVELETAFDAVVLATKSETDVGADCLSVAQVRTIYRAGSPVYNWGQLGFDQVPLSVAGPSELNAAFSFTDGTALGGIDPSMLDFRNDYHAEQTEESIREFVTGSTADSTAASLVPSLTQQVGTLTAILAGGRKTLAGADEAVREAADQVTKGIVDVRPAATQAQDTATLVAAQGKQLAAQRAIVQLTGELSVIDRQIIAGHVAQKGLQSATGHLGMFDFAYYAMFQNALRPLEITDSADPENCIFPSQQTVASGAYPLSQPLLVTTSLQDTQRSAIRGFLISYLENAQRLATTAGLVTLPHDVLARELAFFGVSADSSSDTVAPNASVAGANLPATVH